MSHSVVIITWRRPLHVSACLGALADGWVTPEEIVVIDASEDDETANVVIGYPGVTYVRFPPGAGHMTRARNEGLRHVKGTCISFLDDDVRPARGWSQAVQSAFQNPEVAAVAGRVVNGDPGEDQEGVNSIGRLLRRGNLTGNFAADPGEIITVDHGIGANMSFRRDWLARLGGFRDVFPGTAMREDTDIFLRLNGLGGRSVFVPSAVVQNDSGSHVVGRRFDLRYAVWGEHNHLLLLVLNYGTSRRSPVWAYLRFRLPQLAHDEPERRPASRAARGVGRLAGMLVGGLRGLYWRQSRRGRQVREDHVGRDLRVRLSS
ncbi:glycosyltransferase family 2 protein [Rhodococcus antarcticus]|uniref:glycosyltransferase family 2 protein n=1 Tax=Rhodococcus antarcticus TaxID=2987751 RepID=UPI00338D86EA